ncbi:MAG: sigma-54-dependent Fis family transcriptional regulator [Planctomycetota bacterium]|nr:MAG: sigma-54-dependent Fis family transcriptional regulator [Planctomycetota bacterium]
MEGDRRRLPEDSERELRWLRTVRLLCERAAAAAEPAELLEGILDAALRLSEAERAFLVRVFPGATRVRVVVARGFRAGELASEAGRVSRRVVERALEQRRAILTSAAEDAELLSLTSVAGEMVRSIACVPLLLRGEPWGVLYLDHRRRAGLFGSEDLPVLRSFADQCVLALLCGGGATWEAPPLPALERFGGLVGRSSAMRRLYEVLQLSARSSRPLLLVGEAGSGKERVARALHELWAAPGAPFVRVACAGCAPEELLARLFGSRGRRDRPAEVGGFARARRGTLYLSGLEAAEPALVERLAEAIRTGRARPWGGGPSSAIECRFVGGATLGADAGDEGSGRADPALLRLGLVRVRVPPLRVRREDLPLLVESLAEERGWRFEVDPAAQRFLAAHSWPGNVRELRNEIERWSLAGLRRIAPEDLSPCLRAARGLDAAALRRLLDRVGGNKAEAARRLGVPRSTFYGLLRRHGVG